MVDSPMVVQDIFEPKEIEKDLAKVLAVHRQNLVPLGLGDYYWDFGTRFSLERKKADQVLNEMGARLDIQLEKHSLNADVIGLLVEDIVTPRPDGSCQVWARKGGIFAPVRKIAKEFTGYQAYLWRLRQEGILVFETPDMHSTALAIASWVYSSLKPEGSHKTFRKHHKPQVQTFSRNPYVETLMGVRNARIGEKTALKLFERFKTPFDVFVADYSELVSAIGESAAESFLKGIGRRL